MTGGRSAPEEETRKWRPARGDEEEMTRGRRGQPILSLQRYDIAVERGRKHTRHTDIVSWGDGGAARRLEKGYLQSSRILCRLELFFLPHDSARPGSSSCTSLIAGMPLLN